MTAWNHISEVCRSVAQLQLLTCRKWKWKVSGTHHGMHTRHLWPRFPMTILFLWSIVLQCSHSLLLKSSKTHTSSTCVKCQRHTVNQKDHLKGLMPGSIIGCLGTCIFSVSKWNVNCWSVKGNWPHAVLKCIFTAWKTVFGCKSGFL